MNKTLLAEWWRDLVRGIRFVLWGPEIKTPQQDRKERLGRLLRVRPVDDWQRRNHD